MVHSHHCLYSCPMQSRCGSHSPVTRAAELTCNPSACQPCWEPLKLWVWWPVPASCLPSPSCPCGIRWAGMGAMNTCMGGDLHNNPFRVQTSGGQVPLLACCWEPTPACGHAAVASSAGICHMCWPQTSVIAVVGVMPHQLLVWCEPPCLPQWGGGLEAACSMCCVQGDLAPGHTGAGWCWQCLLERWDGQYGTCRVRPSAWAAPWKRLL